MSMISTPGFIKAFVAVYYMNSEGAKHHMMSFQLATAKLDDVVRAQVVRDKCIACQLDPEKMQNYIKTAIEHVRKNGYDITLVFGVV